MIFTKTLFQGRSRHNPSCSRQRLPRLLRALSRPLTGLLVASALVLSAESVRAQTSNEASLPRALGEPRSIQVAPAYGAVSDRIPLVVPPGRRNVEPKLTLSYSSMSSLGDLGLGWQLATGRVWLGDGTPPAPGNAAFSYALAGAGGELLDSGGGVYRARMESVYREFRKLPDADSNGFPDGWEMRNGEGVLHRFGGTPESRIDGQLWLLDLVQDPSGNTITYAYERHPAADGALYPKEIRYTGFAPTGDPGANRVVFEYEDRVDTRVTYQHALREERTRRLRRVSMFAGGVLARRYEFAYALCPTSNRSMLATVTLVGADDLSRITLRTLEYGSRPIGWAGKAILNTIPGDLADSDGRDTGVRIIDVNGDGFADVVGNGFYVFLGDGSGASFAYDATWSASLLAVGVTFVVTSGDYQGADRGVRLMDIDSDGFPDLLIAQPERRQVWLNTGTGWAYSPSWSASLDSLGQKADVLVDPYYLDNPEPCTPPHCYGSQGSFPGCTPPHCTGSDDDPPDCVPPHCTGSSGDPSDCLPAHCTHVPDYSLPWDQEAFALVEDDGDSKGVQIADVNGDGRPDIVWSMLRSDLLYYGLLRVPARMRGVFLNTGDGWEKSYTLTSALSGLPDFVSDSQLQGYDTQDVNGDGLADVVRTWPGAQAVYLGSGTGWVFDPGFSQSLAANNIFSLDGDRRNQGLMPADFDDDGLVDYLFSKAGYWALAFRNTGAGWTHSPEMSHFLAANGIAFVYVDDDDNSLSTGFTLADMDGDGISDILRAQYGTSWLRTSSTLRAGLLVKATSALGEVTELAWASSTSYDNRRADGREGMPYPVPVPASTIRRDGRGNDFLTRFEYSGGLFEDRQLRGFRQAEQSRPGEFRLTTLYHQEEGLAGQLEVEEGYDARDRLRTRRSSLYEKVMPLLPLELEQVRLVQTDQEAIDPGGARHSRVMYSYDDRLNCVSVRKDPEVALAGDETTTIFSWVRNVAAGIWSLPARVRTLGPDSSLASESVFSYDGLPEGQALRGLPTTKQDLVEVGTYVAKSMRYDQYGNVTRVIDRDGNATEFEYGDPTITFRTRAVDPEARELRSEYDPRFGKVVRDVDASGNATFKAYDAFGRVSRVTLPGDEYSPFGTRSYAYSPLGDPTSQHYSLAETETPGEPDTLDTRHYFDGLGLVYRFEREGADGRSIVTLNEFDDSGNTVATSRPFFEGDAPLMTFIERDELHRPVSVVEPDGIAVTMTYAGVRTDLVDRRGYTNSFHRNVDGDVTEIHQWVDDQEQVTRYEYDALGRLTTIFDALGEETRIFYDMLGRRVRFEDPNAGAYAYRYDGEGRLIEQRAPGAQVTRFRYNRAGNLVRKEFPDGTTIEFTYGEAGLFAQPNSVGQLVQIVDAAGVVAIEYDARGNAVERQRTTLGRTYVTGFDYDSLERIRRVTYPDGFIVDYEYDAAGNIARLTDGQGRVVSENTGHSAAGQIGAIDFGNGVGSAYGYDELLRMTSIDTFTAGSETLQSLEYAFDPGGNVLSITDHAFGASQAFEYDSIGRLTRAEGAYGEELYEYDGIGNLLRKGSMVFTVDPEHPQRVVCGLDLEPGGGKAKGIGNNPHASPCGEPLLAGGPQSPRNASRGQGGEEKNPNLARSFALAYDNRGNVVEKGGQRFEYDAENNLVRVRKAKGKVIEENVYDVSGQRVIQRTPSGTTVFIDGIYEETKSHASRHVRAGALLVATVVTPRAVVKHITDVPHDVFGSAGGPGRGAPVLLALVCLTMVGLVSFPTGARRSCVAAFSGIGEGVRRRPGAAIIMLVTIPAIATSTLTRPAFAACAAMEKVQSEKRFYYHSNHLGSVNLVTDDRGKVVEQRDYKPYGERFEWTGPQSGPRELLTTFDGHRYDDATGLYYFGARHYDPELGRFLTADTQVPDPTDPRSLHRYAFAGGNPIRFHDPTGHGFWDWLLNILVIIFTVVLAVFSGGLASFFGLAFFGALAFEIIAISRGLSPLDQDFWISAGTGFVLGAIVAAGLASLPLSFGAGGVGVLAMLGATILVGAMFGAIEATIVHFVNGGGPEGLLEDVLISAGIGAAISAATFGLLRGFGKFVSTGARAASKLVKVAKALAKAVMPLFNVGKQFHAGFTGRTVAQTVLAGLEQFGTALLFALLSYSASPAKSTGIPAWAFAGTWPGTAGGGGGSDQAALLQTMPLGP